MCLGIPGRITAITDELLDALPAQDRSEVVPFG